MQIKHAVEATLKNMGLEIHHVAIDSMNELEHLDILYKLAQITNSNLQSNLFMRQMELEKQNSKSTDNEKNS